MKKHLPLSLIFIAFSVFGVRSQTLVNGFINSGTTWNVSGSPYIVTGNTLVAVGVTLRIDPGVIVKFNTNCALQIDGKLIAVGNRVNHIVFTSNQSVPQPGDWAKLHISQDSPSAIFDAAGNYLSGTILKYCDLLYGGSLGYGAIHIESSSPYISKCNVQYSKSAGIYCMGSSFVLDSSLVSDNRDYGLYFDQFTQFSCGLKINGDTIRNNANGGLYLGSSTPPCITTVSNNYFVSNSNNGAILDAASRSNVIIKNNNFINNKSGANKAIVYFNSNYTWFHRITIAENNFLNNEGGGIVTFLDQSDNINIISNNFTNNISQTGIITTTRGLTSDTIRCNSFINNRTMNAVIALKSPTPLNSGIIFNNVFDGNVNNDSLGYSVLEVKQTNLPLEFANNTVRNNTAVNGACCYINAHLANSTEMLRIHHNDFINNNSSKILYLDGPLTNDNTDFLYMKFNNFRNPACHYELFNHIPYGSPAIQADSNYWGSLNTQHLDSVTYDFFDYANYSVVYYQPVLTQPALIDTVCGMSIPLFVRGIRNDNNVHSAVFPNPFSNSAEISFSKELKDASLIIYNVVGQVKGKHNHINGSLIYFERENLSDGIYFYEIIEGNRSIAKGKFIVE